MEPVCYWLLGEDKTQPRLHLVPCRSQSLPEWLSQKGKRDDGPLVSGLLFVSRMCKYSKVRRARLRTWWYPFGYLTCGPSATKELLQLGVSESIVDKAGASAEVLLVFKWGTHLLGT